jgi:hypothetical protein
MRAYYELKDYSNAVSDVYKILELDPSNVEAQQMKFDLEAN